MDKHLASMAKKATLKHAQRHPRGSAYQHLKRNRFVAPTGRWLQASQKHVEAVAVRLGLDKANPSKAPCSQSLRPEATDEDELLSGEQCTEFRSLVCTLLYASYDLVESQFAVRQLACDMVRPTTKSWQRLKHLTRYLRAASNEGIWFCKPREEEGPLDLRVSTDTDWAGCRLTRKSCGMTIIRCAGNLMFSQCTGQAIHAQSSGESEFYGACSGAAAGLALQHALQFFCVHTRLVLETDSSAARAIMNRKGIGKLRHLEVKTLWLQAKVNSKQIAVQCIAGEHNPADLGTKALAGDRVRYLKDLLKVGPIDYSMFKQTASEAVVASIRVATEHKRGRGTRIASGNGCPGKSDPRLYTLGR